MCATIECREFLLTLDSYKKAYESMKACPLTFSHPSEAQQLHGLGPKLCDRLTDELTKHCAANGLPPPKKCNQYSVPRSQKCPTLTTGSAQKEEP